MSYINLTCPSCDERVKVVIGDSDYKTFDADEVPEELAKYVIGDTITCDCGNTFSIVEIPKKNVVRLGLAK